MSFYDSASLAFLPSGGAGKDGKAYSIKPVPEYGNELITNGGFDTDSDWSITSGTDVNISNGKANFVNAAKGQRLQQNFTFTANKTYKIVLEVSNYTSGILGFYMGGGYVFNDVSANGTYTYYFTPSNTAEAFLRAMQTGVLHNFSIDNVSVKEVIVDGDFTFSRGSNLTATRVDSNGLIEKGRENLLLQSNQFDTSWTLNSTSVTSGQSGYDGTNDAWLLNSTTTGFPRIEQLVSASGINTYSVYLKPATDGFINMRIFGADAAVWFNANDGLIANASGSQYVSSNIQSVGNGWYRCSVIVNGSITSVRIYPASSYGTYSTSGNGVYIQDAQLEQGLVATEYIESGASKGKAGLLENSPRFDYSGGASCPSLLLEPSRTNQIRLSEYFEDTTNYDLRSADVTTNYAISPEGVQNATKVTPQNATTDFRIQTQFTFGVSGDNVLSVFAKYESGGFQYLVLATNATFQTYAFDIQNGTKVGNAGGGTIADADATIEDYGNGWYRCSIKSNNTGNADGVIYLSDDGTNTTATGDGSKGMLIYGFQGEQLVSYPTSYIPNHSGGSVTRELDHCFTSSNSVLEEINATYFLEVTPIQITSNNILEVRANGSTNNRIVLQTNSGGALRVLVRAQGSSVLDQNISGAVSANTKVKIALKYTDRTNISVFVDGVKEIDTDLVIDFSPELNGLDLEGSATANNDSLKQHQFIFFPTALSDTDCEILTGTSYESFAAMATALNYTTYE